jgi:hypothetical protein
MRIETTISSPSNRPDHVMGRSSPPSVIRTTKEIVLPSIFTSVIWLSPRIPGDVPITVVPSVRKVKVVSMNRPPGPSRLPDHVPVRSVASRRKSNGII